MQLTPGRNRPTSKFWYGPQSLCPVGVGHVEFNIARTERFGLFLCPNLIKPLRSVKIEEKNEDFWKVVKE